MIFDSCFTSHQPLRPLELGKEYIWIEEASVRYGFICDDNYLDTFTLSECYHSRAELGNVRTKAISSCEPRRVWYLVKIPKRRTIIF